MTTIRYAGIARILVAALVVWSPLAASAQSSVKAKTLTRSGALSLLPSARPSPAPQASPATGKVPEAAVLSEPTMELGQEKTKGSDDQPAVLPSSEKEPRATGTDTPSGAKNVAESDDEHGSAVLSKPAGTASKSLTTPRKNTADDGDEPGTTSEEEGPGEETSSSVVPTPIVTGGSLASLPPVTTAASVTRIYKGDRVLKLNLGQAISRSLAANPGLKATGRDIDAARWRYYQQRSLVTPRLDGWARYTHQTTPPSMGTFNIGGFKVGPLQAGVGDLHDQAVQVKHTLYTFGRQSNALKQRRNETQSARETYGDSADDLILSVKKEFYSILLQKSLIETAELTLKELKTQHDYALARFQQGAATEYDVLLARSQLANAKPQLISALHALEISSQNLLSLLGIDEPIQLVAEGTFDDKCLTVTFDQCLAASFAYRQDLKSLQSQRQAMWYSVKSLRANGYPTLSASGQVDHSKGTRSPTSEYVGIDNVAFSLDIPLYDGGSSRAQSREARAKLKKLDEQIENLKLTIRSQVSEAFLQVEQAHDVIDSARESLNSSSMAFINSQEGFQAGVRTSLEVLTAETQLTSARTNLAQAQHDCSVAKATLARVTRIDPSAPAAQAAQAAAHK